jgi:proteasome assembly chaperone (PAC2) family protein
VTYLNLIEQPQLRRPVLVLAFSGWVDGGAVATTAVRFLVEHWDAKKFAEIDPEEFYNFTRERPQVSLEPDFSRTITWPETALYYHVDPLLDRDFVLLVGVEPNFKWRTFSQEILSVCQSVGVTTALSLGGVIADVPHTHAAHITVFTSDPELQDRFPELTARRGGYQGPTGIIGVITDGLTRADIPVSNLRGAVPHYIAGSPNPKVSYGLLERLSELYSLGLDLSDLAEASRRFEDQVDESLADRPEMAEYVKKLEERTEDPGERPQSLRPDVGPASGEPLPDAGDIVRQLEDFFRERSGGEEEPPPSGPERS